MRFVIILLFLFSNLLPTTAFSQLNKELNNGVERPKLVIGIVVDQMRWDYLYRYYNRYSKGGFKRMLEKGFSYENTVIPYTPTVTAAGHTCIYTGSIPALHGIVGNDWVEKVTGEAMYCSQDKTVQTVGSNSLAGQMSPRNMLASTIGDELRRASNNKSRVFGIALKDRGAILPAGHSANAAYWFDDATGHWITSSYYMNSLPTWVNNFNAKKYPETATANGWNLLYDISMYDQSITDNNDFEKKISGETTVTFPHKYSFKNGTDYKPFRYSPYANTFTFNFANQLLQNEKLGQSGQTDMLCISLSATDYLGHTFGPQSLEMEDTYLRLDSDVESFFNMLDVNFPEKNYVVFLTADHGASYTTSFMKATKQAAGNAFTADYKSEIETYLFKKYNIKNLLKDYIEYQFYLNDAKIDSAKISKKEVEQTVVSVLQNRQEVMYAFAYSNFTNIILPEFLKSKLVNGYFPKRSGDIQIILKPQYILGSEKGTEHGVVFNYDTHIPLLWYGSNVKSGSSYNEVFMTDIAATIAAMLHIQMPSTCIGKVLTEIVK